MRFYDDIQAEQLTELRLAGVWLWTAYGVVADRTVAYLILLCNMSFNCHMVYRRRSPNFRLMRRFDFTGVVSDSSDLTAFRLATVL